MGHPGKHMISPKADMVDLGESKSKPPIRLKLTEFCMKQFAKRMRQPNFRTFNKWNKVWVAGVLEKKHRFITGDQTV
jgi:hypothetical protein